MSNTAMTWWEKIYEFFYPSSCLSCGESLQYSYKELFCPLCHMYITISDCHTNPDHPLRHRLNTLFPFDLILSKYRFPTNSRSMEGILKGLKYQNLRYIGFVSGSEYGNVVAPLLKDAQVSVLIAVPLHRRKRMSRGYNQSIEWAKGISSTTGIPIDSKLVQRIKFTRSQTMLNKEERKQNIKNAFQVNSRNTRYDPEGNHHFLLLDDVITSGITLTELAKTMKSHFPNSRFSVCTLAYRDY